ncbi:hypothetical protein QJS10_CPB21g01239 [Acorus calamus]|uniref:Uncharacterized protein n=1 Tax=Acorus calamus TaxID=4465 RepID=A0AAV9C4N9_ACOCL|nr:hypothetical protein QJS10_CPB21g01239 [Acorus calamus]
MNPFCSFSGARSCPDLSLTLLPTNESHTRLFGVDLSKPSKKKSKSMIDLNTYPSSSYNSTSHSNDSVPKKKRVSVRWTNEEHMRFLEGLLALGKGEWGRIARDYVITKNTTQVTSHAQKHFLHQSSKNAGKQRKGSSIFDLHPPPRRKGR